MCCDHTCATQRRMLAVSYSFALSLCSLVYWNLDDSFFNGFLYFVEFLDACFHIYIFPSSQPYCLFYKSSSPQGFKHAVHSSPIPIWSYCSLARCVAVECSDFCSLAWIHYFLDPILCSLIHPSFCWSTTSEKLPRKGWVFTSCIYHCTCSVLDLDHFPSELRRHFPLVSQNLVLL